MKERKETEGKTVYASAPTRISFFGGGTDIPIYSKKYGGLVINMAINLRQQIELDDKNNVIDLLDKDSRSFFSVFLSQLESLPIGIKHRFDAISESGLGSSASLAVTLVGAVCKLKNIPMNRMEIAEKAWDIEVNKLGLYGGKQDQCAAVWGNMNTIWFNQDGTIYRKEFEGRISKYLISHSLLFYSGENRKTAKIQEKFKEPSNEQVDALHEIKKCANFARKVFEFGDMEKIGRLLDTAWQFKKKSNPLVTNERIDRIYDEATLCGAWGGKILGSGGGGYMLFMAEPRCHEEIITKLKGLNCTHVDFSIDKNGLDVREI